MRACARCGIFVERGELCEPCEELRDRETIRSGVALRHRNNAFTGIFITAVALSGGLFFFGPLLFACIPGGWLSARELVATFRPNHRELLGARFLATASAAVIGSVLALAGLLMLAIVMAFTHSPAA